MSNNRRGESAKSSQNERTPLGDGQVPDTKKSGTPNDLLSTNNLVTDGKLSGQRITYPILRGKIPIPAAERMAVFARIGDLIGSARFLDLCAGTGAIGIEAVSRGVQVCTFVERKLKRCEMIRENLQALGIKDGHGEVFEEEAVPFLKKMSRKRRFWDIVFWDPPHDTDYDDAFRFLAAGAVIRPEGKLLLRHHSEMFFESRIGRLKRRSVFEAESSSVSFFERYY
ncbi:MAG: hypothetical protein DWQ47_02145 [Acidobacteria bacterium]|nr:MAG: hypothetical protein DWQ32_05695 [Acidobacteriota bacterium]REK01222.1 MAG: hypothetical protein DWQ38_02130 [Acidobacteriota bacterium]REK14178.1 MAG: hypothetical protein DWQ43_11385 [Acidobacteriota bacterium]REK44893.1 MAG: hypothetical protein DWQ47_02145 [Acidobacteriota bacterium]